MSDDLRTAQARVDAAVTGLDAACLIDGCLSAEARDNLRITLADILNAVASDERRRCGRVLDAVFARWDGGSADEFYEEATAAVRGDAVSGRGRLRVGTHSPAGRLIAG